MFQKLVQVRNAVTVGIVGRFGVEIIEVSQFPKIGKAISIGIFKGVGPDLEFDLVDPGGVGRGIEEAVIFRDFVATFLIDPAQPVSAGGEVVGLELPVRVGANLSGAEGIIQPEKEGIGG